MVKNRKLFQTLSCLIVLVVLFLLPGSAYAQTYRFNVNRMEVEAYINEDGTVDMLYLIEFINEKSADAIDFVDIGMPSSSYDLKNIEASVDGKPVTKIEDSPYVQNGFALELGSNAIQPGQTGVVIATIYGVQNVLQPYTGSDRTDYTSFQFSPNWFGSEYERGSASQYRVTIILPPGVEDPNGLAYTPKNFPSSDSEYESGLTKEGGRIFYSWYSEKANGHTQYIFGCAFPSSAVPQQAIVPVEKVPENTTKTNATSLGSILNFDNLCCFGFGTLFVGIFGFAIYQSTIGAQKRKLKYLPPKISIEGHGIKRGLTAVEAAIVMERPIDKIMTMILFGTLKKGAATVITREPLKLEVAEPMPENLHAYEIEFLESMNAASLAEQRKKLQLTMVNLVKSTSLKMKGFSRKETVAYYEDIERRAWKMIEDAGTPELKSEQFDKTLEWTMLDDQFNDRTKRTFTGMPVFVPIWWHRYDPVYRSSLGTAGRSIGNMPTSAGGAIGGGSKSGGMSLPHLPGSDFAASLVNGMTGMAGGLLGNVGDFTSGITAKTNPIPKITSSGSGSRGFRGGGGGSCACACACAGCACACAGGGR